MRYAFQVAYDGSRYFGFVRQPGLRTIEGELLRALQACGLYKELKTARYRVASRTDRGVSALCQVIALNLLKRPNLRALNASLPKDIAFLAAAKVDQPFDPRRHALRKRYRYLCAAPQGFDLARAQKAAKLLVGRHDFRNFCKREKGRSAIMELEHVSIRGRRRLSFDFTAKAFLWQQVRRLVNALLKVGSKELTIAELRRLLKGEVNAPIPPAPPEGLILMYIEYADLELRPDPQLAKPFIGYLQSELAAHTQRVAVLKNIMRLLRAQAPKG